METDPFADMPPAPKGGPLVYEEHRYQWWCRKVGLDPDSTEAAAAYNAEDYTEILREREEEQQ